LSQLKNFRSGDRANDGGKMMQVIARKMTDQEMKAVAEYINGLR
jgi:cytochrome c553